MRDAEGLRRTHSHQPYRVADLQWPMIARVSFEFLVVVAPQLLTMTVLADFSAIMLALIALTAISLHVAAVVMYGRPIFSTRYGTDHAIWHLLSERKMTFLNNFRSGMMIAT